MHMSFWFDYTIQDFLFTGLNINSITGLLLLCISLIGIAAAFEGLKVLHAEVKIKSALLYPKDKHKHPSSIGLHDNTTLLGDFSRIGRRRQAACYLVDVGLYATQVVVGYMLMLSVMTYNGYVSLAVMFGVALGYALFGQILIERRIKNAKLSMPCQNCLIQLDKSSKEAEVEGESTSTGCCSQQVHETINEISN